MEPQQNSSLFSLNLDAQNSYTLRGAASWARVLGVVGLILGILFIIAGILVQQAMQNQYGYRSLQRGGISATSFGNIGLTVYVVMGLIMIITSVFALNCGNKINQALRTNDQMALNSGFANARNYFAFWAVLIILMLLLFVLGLLGSMT